ncbi:MAG: hypothetical protein OXE94_05710 [Aestuariivita sp.]|nr:hypothetical protein [Aestuariivita sp.]MCY4203630.1 hypothetical protein [Aestuariivita sp.]MCY4347824.1 hypothetical protein [Aestuariivita sp.]
MTSTNRDRTQFSLLSVALLLLLSGAEVYANQATGMIQGSYAGLVQLQYEEGEDPEWEKVCIAVSASEDIASVKLILYADGERKERFAADLPLKSNPTELANPNTPGSIIHTLQGIFAPIQGSTTNYGGERRLFEGSGWRGYLGGITNSMRVQMNNSVTPLPEGVPLNRSGGYKLTENASCDTL